MTEGEPGTGDLAAGPAPEDEVALVRAALAAMLADAPLGFAVLDEQLRYVRVNERLAAINGIPAAAHIGRALAEVVPDLAPSAEAAFRRVLESGQPLREVRFSGEVPSSPGVVRHWTESVYPVPGAAGRPVGLAVVVFEDTSRVEAEVERARTMGLLDLLIARAPIGVAFLDDQLRYVRINQTLAALNGLPVVDHLGRTVAEVLPEIAVQVTALLQQVLETGVPIIDVELETGPVPAEPGRRRHWRVSCYPVAPPDGHGPPEGVGLIVTDETDRFDGAAEQATLWAAERSAAARIEQALRRQERSRRLTAALASATTVSEVAAAVVELAPAVLGASAAVLNEGDTERGLQVLATVGLPPEVAATGRVFPPPLPPLLADVLTGGRVLVSSTAERDRRYPDLVGWAVPQQAWANLVLHAQGRVLGALAFGWDAPREFDEEEIGLLSALADQCAVALDRARLYQVERAARRRAELLHRLTGELSRAVSPGAVSAVFVAHLGGVGAVAGSIYLLDPARARLVLADAVGEGDVVEDWQVLPLEAGVAPVADVVRSGVPSLLHSVEEIRTLWPGLEPVRASGDYQAWASLPLTSMGRVLGAVAYAFGAPQEFDGDQVRLLEEVAARVASALARSQLYAAEQAARRRADLLARIGARLEAGRTAGERMQALVDLLVPEIADRATIEVPGPGGRPRMAVSATRPTERAGPRAGPSRADVEDGLARVLATGQREFGPASPPNTRHTGATAGIGGTPTPTSWLILPLRAGGQVLAALLLEQDQSGRRFTASDLPGLDEVADLAALAIDLAARYERERTIALQLQTAMLPAGIATGPAVRAAVRYRAAEAGLQVGGDWYDLIALPGGRFGATVGDVVGHGLPAATAMGQLRSATAALALVVDGPAQVLDGLDVVAEQLPAARYATVTYLDLDPATGLLRYASAGHPPPVLLPPEGPPRLLDAARSRPLCAQFGASRHEAVLRLAPGSRLLLFTDGLIERRDSDLDAGLAALQAALTRHRELDPEALTDALLDALLAGRPPADDVALICLAHEPSQSS